MSTVADTADTRGWDTVYALSTDTVNQGIVSAGKTPPNFNFAVTHLVPLKAQGTFSPWQITPGGSGPELHLKAVIKTGTLHVDLVGNTPPSADATLDGTEYIISLALAFFEKDNTKAAQTTIPKAPLYLKTDATQPVTQVSIKYGPAFQLDDDIATTVQAIFEKQLLAWFNTNAAAFEHVFHTFDINAVVGSSTIKQNDFAWLNPTATGYAQDAGGKGVFGVLSTTDTTGPSKLSQLSLEISALAIPPGAPTGLLISADNFLRHFILPGLSTGTDAWGKPSDFAVSSGGTVLSNVNPLSFPFTTDKGTKYTGVIEDANNLSISVLDDKLQIDISRLSIEATPGIFLIVEFHETLKVVLKTRDDGAKVFWLEGVGTPVIKTHTEDSQAVEITMIVTGIVVSIVLAALGLGSAGKFVSMGMSKIGARILAVVLTVVATAIAQTIINTPNFLMLAEQNNFKGMPDFGTFVQQAVGKLNWPGATGFKLVSADLKGSLRVGIDPVFKFS